MSKKTSRWMLVVMLSMVMVAGFTLGASASSFRLNAMGHMYGIVDDEIDALLNPALFADAEQPQAAVEFTNYASSDKTENLVAKTSDTWQSGTTSLESYFALPMALSGMKNAVAAELYYGSSYNHDIHPTYNYDRSHPQVAWGIYDGLRLSDPLAVGFGFHMVLPDKDTATYTYSSGDKEVYTYEWKYPVNTLLAGATFKLDEQTQISAQGSYETKSGDYIATYQFNNGTVNTTAKQKDANSNMGIQAKVKRDLGNDLTGVGLVGFGSGSSGYTPDGSTVKNETKTSNFNVGAGVVKKFNSSLVAAKAIYALNSYKYSDEPAYAGTYKSQSYGNFNVGVGAEMAIMKGLVARAGIEDTFSSTTSVVRADNSTEKASSSGIVTADLGLGYSFGNYQVDLLIPVFSTTGSENKSSKANTSDRTIQLSMSAKF